MKPLLSFIILLLLETCTPAQEPLALVDRGEVRHLRENCRWLLKSLDELRSPVPEETRRELERHLANGCEGPEAMVAMQKLLDPLCLVGVTINPESRVKGTRGAAAAELTVEAACVFLVKVQNDAGVTQALTLSSPNVAGSLKQTAADRWLHAVFHAGDAKAPPRKLSGHEVEYLILVCQARESGKREAKLIFDVGQGTQDLGFRAEVPILFTIRRP